MLKKRNQKGFTLIEIIAVLVILGILAAVAIPKFFDMQDEAKLKNAQAAVASAQSAISMAYANYLLNSSAPNSASPSAACQSVQLDAPSSVPYNVSCTGGNWDISSSNITANYDTKSATGTWTKP
ncbi:MAG TPA: type II secretion system protein [Syntrophales bacterium]|nr:type II secretion system protein [Syntrophales bacterium]